MKPTEKMVEAARCEWNKTALISRGLLPQERWERIVQAALDALPDDMRIITLVERKRVPFTLDEE